VLQRTSTGCRVETPDASVVRLSLVLSAPFRGGYVASSNSSAAVRGCHVTPRCFILLAAAAVHLFPFIGQPLC
jgi:hypothetical protein